MTYHIVAGRLFDLEKTANEAENGLCPRHGLVDLANMLDAKFHGPDEPKTILADKFLSKLAGRPDIWAMSRRLARGEIKDGDVVFCTGEDVGLPLAAMCYRRGVKAKVASFIHNIDRIRAKVALRVLRTSPAMSLFFAVSRHQTEFLSNHLGVPDRKLKLVWDMSDLDFFTPGPKTRKSDRPLIVSAGLEQRDYRTLAEAIDGLDVDVRITGFSADAKMQAKAMPDVMPENMRQDFYPWPDLVQLYRDADVVVVTTFPTTYASGVQALMEGMGCKRPIIATATEGLQDYTKDPETVLTVPTGDSAAMRDAILKVIEDKTFAEAQAARGYAQAHERYGHNENIEILAKALRAL